MQKKYLSISLFFIFIILLSFFVNNVSAYGYTNLAIDATTNSSYPDGAVVTTSTNKLIYVHSAYEAENFKISVFTASGVLEATKTSVIPNIGGYPIYDLHGLAIRNYNSTHAIIMTVGSAYSGSIYYLGCVVALYKIVTNTLTYYVYHNNDQLEPNCYQLGAEILINNSNGHYYNVVSYKDHLDNGYYCYMDFYNNTLSMVNFDNGQDCAGTATGYYKTNYVFGFIENNTIFYFNADINDYSLPKFYRFYIPANTSEYLCDFPINLSMPNANRHMKYIAGGFKHDGNYWYLYNVWAYDIYVSVTEIKIMLSVIVFNDTIGASTIVDNNRAPLAVIAEGWYTESLSLWVVGVANDYDDYNVYFADYDQEESKYSTGEVYITISSFFSDAPDWNVIYYTATSEFFIPYVSFNDIIGKDLSSTFQVNELNVYSSARIYYDLTPLYTDYNIIMTYTPNDDPLFTNKTYTFTVQTLINDAGSSQFIIITGGYTGTRQTTLSGFANFTAFRSISGLMIFNVTIKDNGVSVYSETFSYNVIDAYPDDIPDTEVLPYTINVIMAFLPTLFIVFVPAFALASVSRNMLGLIAGLTIGVGIAFMVGLVSPYVMFLLAFVIIMLVLYTIRKGE